MRISPTDYSVEWKEKVIHIKMRIEICDVQTPWESVDNRKRIARGPKESGFSTAQMSSRLDPTALIAKRVLTLQENLEIGKRSSSMVERGDSSKP